MSECQHERQYIETRTGDKYGQNVLAHCACGLVSTGWKSDERIARICFGQIVGDSYGFAKLLRNPEKQRRANAAKWTS
jgi:hypothetical protein